MGTDTIEGVLAARRYYGADMPGFSIPAAEHSTITSWGGPEYESQAFENMLNQFAKPGKLVAVVSDSYDIYNATSNIWGSELLEKVKNSGATVVVRPDSGDPTIVPIEVIELLMEKVGYTINRLGYKVLPSYFRVIQGDGINVESIRTILQTMKAAGLSASNIAFGQGGGLLQQVNRDTQKFAMKCSAIEVNGVWRDVWKDPISDSGKQSKRGRLALIESTGIGGGVWRTILETEVSSHIPTTLRTVFDTGIISNITSFESVRALASKEFSVREDT